MHQYVPLRASMGQHCSLSAVQKKIAVVEQSWWAWTENVWINAIVFVPMAKAPPKAGAKDLSYNSLKAFTRKHAFVDISVFAWLGKERPRFAQGQPKGNFPSKEPHKTAKAYSQMNPDWKVDKAHYAEFNVPTCGKIAVWQLCRETQPLSPLWNGHDSWWPGLNLRCLDQCHGVRSHGKSSYQGWRKIVVQSKFDPWAHILVLTEGNFGRFA